MSSIYLSQEVTNLVEDNDPFDNRILFLRQEHPRKLIPQLCKQFYDLGWVTGTGGGISIKLDDEIYIAPSGVQKERY